MSFSEFTAQDHQLISREYAELREAARRRCGSEEELDVVQKAFDFANEAHKNVRRRSGEPYILHPIAVARIVVNEIGLGYKSISAALLHDVVEDTDYTVEDLRQLFGDKIASLVDGLTKIKTVLDNEDRNKQDEVYSQSLQAENFKRILLTLNDDVRVVLIKLADRLHNCRTIEFMLEHKRDKILSETMFIFIPLAHRLGLYNVKSELENIWLRYKEPDAYNDITRKVNRNLIDKEREIDAFIAPIQEALQAAGFDFEIRKRVKTPYSIWHKMQSKKVSFEQVYDLYAIRIVFDPRTAAKDRERDECYHIFSIISGIYRYMPERLRDWVRHPKNNGYEALHCTLLSERGIWVEVQIRTRRMDDIAEKGIAAHWVYKQSGYVGENDSEMDRWLLQVKDILVNPDVNALELLDIIHKDLVATDILVFTPKGEQKSVPKGATALDFAYMIHSEIGHQAIAAKVNMKLVPLSHTLHTGDQIEIITAEDEHPKREWLAFLQTHRARALVVDYFKNERAQNSEAGRKMLEEKMNALGYRLTEDTIRQLLVYYELNHADELFFRIGIGLIPLGKLNEILKSASDNFYQRFFKLFRGSGKEKKGKDFVINSNDGHPYVIAPCCRPIPGDAVIGLLSPDGTVTVHKKSCGIAESVASKHGERVVVPQWETSADEASFLVRLSLRGVDRMGILNEISRYISLVMGVNMRRLSIGTEEGIFEGYIDLYVSNKEVLERIIKKLGSIDGIQSVVRSEL